MFCASAQRNDATVNPATQMMNSFLRPKRSESQAMGAVMIAAATMYDVSTQLIWSRDADSDPCI